MRLVLYQKLKVRIEKVSLKQKSREVFETRFLKDTVLSVLYFQFYTNFVVSKPAVSILLYLII